MQYIKHYWVSVEDGTYCCHENITQKRHPEEEFPGLDVKVWLHDEDGIDVCLSVVPNTTEVVDIVDEKDPTKKCVQVLTKKQFDSVSVPLQELMDLRHQAMNPENAEQAEELNTQADEKLEQAKQALYAL